MHECRSSFFDVTDSRISARYEVYTEGTKQVALESLAWIVDLAVNDVETGS